MFLLIFYDFLFILSSPLTQECRRALISLVTWVSVKWPRFQIVVKVGWMPKEEPMQPGQKLHYEGNHGGKPRCFPTTFTITTRALVTIPRVLFTNRMILITLFLNLTPSRL